jgi:hypothetical protein
MLNQKKKLALEELHSLLAGWSTGVPGRARRFQALRADLDRQVTAALARWWLPGLGEDELAALRQQVERLGELAPLLTALILQAEADEKEVLDLRARAEREDDRELAGWLIDRCVDWQSALRRLGTHVEREPELEKDLAVLTKTGDLARLYAKALRRLEEAQQFLDRLGSRMETAVLRADLPLLRQRLLAEGASPAWLADMERAVGAVRAVVEVPPKQPPQTLQQVPDLLAEARRWQRTLATGEERNADLLERYRLAEKDWEHLPEGEVQALLQDAGEALSDLRRIAAERCAAALARLAERSLQLADACGSSADLERELDALRIAAADDPDSYEEWMERQIAVGDHLLQIAGANIGSLQARIDQLRQDFGARLETLRHEPLSSQGASELERLSLELAGLPDFKGDNREALFQSLAACDRIAVALDALAVRVRGERDALSAMRQRLLARHRSLREEVTRSGIEVLDLEPRIAALATAEPGVSLDDLRRQAEMLELELAACEKEFMARCAAWLAERLSALRNLVDLLQRASCGACDLPEPPGEGSPPSQWAQAVVAIGALEDEVHRRFESLQIDLEARGDEFRSRLAQLPLGSLRPEVRRDATDLSLWLSERSWSHASKPEERVRKLLDGLARCELFLTKLSQEDREAQARAEALRARLQEFNERDHDRYCPDELVQRVSALIAGIPAEPRRWGEVTDQLDVVEDLLERLQTHARRVLAARLEQAIPGLERQAAGTKDPAFARRIRALLAELAACDEHEAIPATLSARILLLAPERAWEGPA